MLDPTLLQSFLAVAQTRNFTEAGRRLGLQQSTVSQHVRKLEAASGRKLFLRDTHRVVPTADGEAMVGFARSILDANERAQQDHPGPQLRRQQMRKQRPRAHPQRREQREGAEEHHQVQPDIACACQRRLWGEPRAMQKEQ